jgi:antitoxin HicB
MASDPKAHRARFHADRYQFTAVFDPDGKGGYTVTVPALPGLVTEGDTFEEAKAMAEEAIVGYLESLRKHGEPIPVEDSPLVVPVAVSMPR